MKDRFTRTQVGEHHAPAQRDPVRERSRPRHPLEHLRQPVDREERAAKQVQRHDHEALDGGEAVVVSAGGGEGHDRHRKRKTRQRRQWNDEQRARELRIEQTGIEDPSVRKSVEMPHGSEAG